MGHVPRSHKTLCLSIFNSMMSDFREILDPCLFRILRFKSKLPRNIPCSNISTVVTSKYRYEQMWTDLDFECNYHCFNWGSKIKIFNPFLFAVYQYFPD